MKCVCFDIGNVLCHLDFTPFQKALSEQLDITVSQAEYFYNRTQKLHDLGLTNLSDELRDHFRISSKSLVDALMHDWYSIITPEDKMFDFVKWCFDNNIKIFIVSNIGIEHANYMRNVFNQKLGAKIIDDPNFITFFSCDVGARKPSYLYFKTLLDLYPETNGALYIDDLVENLESGKKFGLKTFNLNLRNVDDIDSEIEKIKLLI